MPKTLSITSPSPSLPPCDLPGFVATRSGRAYQAHIIGLTRTEAVIHILGGADLRLSSVAQTFGPWARNTCLLTLGRSAWDPMVARVFARVRTLASSGECEVHVGSMHVEFVSPLSAAVAALLALGQ